VLLNLLLESPDRRLSRAAEFDLFSLSQKAAFPHNPPASPSFAS